MGNTIGFIGLGIMGKPMAMNLIKADYSLVVHDINRSAVGELVQNGAVDGQSSSGVAKKCQIVFTMLPDGSEVEEVICGLNGILESIVPESIVVDMSSISPTVSKSVAEKLQQKQAHYVDAPVSGGEPGAIAGTLAIMVGGNKQIVEKVTPLLVHMGKSVVRVGDIGAGQTVKLVNQILVALHIGAMGEAMLLAKKCKVDCMQTYEAIKNGLAGSNVLNAKVPLVLARNFEPGFKMKLHKKDLRNAMSVAEELGLELPLAKTIQKLLDDLVETGHGEEDHGGLVQAVEKLNDLTIE